MALVGADMCVRVWSSQCNRPITDKLRTINVGIGFNGISLFITRRGVLAPVEEYKCVVARQLTARRRTVASLVRHGDAACPWQV